MKMYRNLTQNCSESWHRWFKNYKKINQAMLKKNGKLIFESGENQKDLCIDLLLRMGFILIKFARFILYSR